MLSVLTVDEVEKRIGEVPGVASATVNYVAGNAAVRYDETLLDVADIKVIVHQRGQQSADEPEPKPVSEDKPAHKHTVEPVPEAAPDAKPSTSVAAPPGAPPPAKAAATPKPSPAVAAVDAPAVGAQNGHEGHTASAAPVGKAAPDAKPSTPEPVVPKAAPVAPTAGPSPASAAVKAAPDVKSSTPATDESRADSWKVQAFSLATTLSVAYILCAIFDVLFPPFGLLAALAPASPLPISGSPLAFLTGFALFTVAGFVLGALHGIAWQFWSKRLR
jgi:copper chaperone CopZ